ncbi:hypothetical protein F0562_014403 [Nyssa sinensis]|uniref:PGG domain-containing protein n=1 Tax=Nyssa sinensis TaxID=561372 RepID=A0A5J4ZSL3_9ASTE|nr:hypothetical protein F0562_014403 [Nyssa sinensis]
MALPKKLYDALMKGEENMVIELCRPIPGCPLHIASIHDDTVLHMATYSKRENLVDNLLKQLPENVPNDEMMRQNDIGNTILHEAATSNLFVPAAQQMLGRAPALLSMRNHNGEIATFRAARYGKNGMFWFLDGQVDNIPGWKGRDVYRKVFYQRTDGTTVLHISLLTEHFGLALAIAEKYEFLVSERDGDNMTALQLLACNSSAFEYGRFPRLFKGLFDRCVSNKDASVTEEVEPRRRVTLWETIQNLKEKYESAMKLAKFLIERDISWEDTDPAVDECKPKIHNYGEASTASEGQGKKIAETPLFLATKSGCTEIVEAILKTYPQAIEHIDHEGRTILHVAIKYRQIQIFDIVEKMEIAMTRLLRKIDKKGNSILHMVGTKAEDFTAKDMRSPALLLQEDMLLFERVKKISPTHFINHCNLKGQTAENLFEENNAKLHEEAKEWLKRTAKNCSIVAVLNATVAFAAANTIPGGPNQNTGYPILLNQPFFLVFTLADVLSLAFALTSVITFLSILTSSFKLRKLQALSSPKINAWNYFIDLLCINDDAGICSDNYPNDT